MRKLLVPIDSGSLSENLKNHLKDFASDMQSEITLFYVIPVAPVEHNLMHFDLYTIRDKNKERFEAMANEILDKAKSELLELGVEKVEKAHAVGDPAAEILKAAGSGQYDLIVMNTHGMGIAKRVVIGSVTNNVVHHAEIPVMTIR